MVTFEASKDNEKLEIHGDREGLLELAKHLTNLAKSSSNNHMNLMTKDWGGSELSSEKQGLDNKIYHHVKLFLWL